MGNKTSYYKSTFQISLPWLYLSFHNACPRHLKSRRDLLYVSLFVSFPLILHVSISISSGRVRIILWVWETLQIGNRRRRSSRPHLPNILWDAQVASDATDDGVGGVFGSKSVSTVLRGSCRENLLRKDQSRPRSEGRSQVSKGQLKGRDAGGENIWYNTCPDIIVPVVSQL